MQKNARLNRESSVPTNVFKNFIASERHGTKCIVRPEQTVSKKSFVIYTQISMNMIKHIHNVIRGQDGNMSAGTLNLGFYPG